MKKSCIIITMLFLAWGNIYPVTGNAYIENVQVAGSTFSWELHFERTDAWTSGLLSDALGASAASFDLDTSALKSPGVVVHAGGPLDNANYNVTAQIIGGKCIVDIGFSLQALAGVLPLNVKTKLLTVSMNITDANQTAGLSWDVINTGFFDNTDATVSTALIGSFDGSLPVELNSFSAETNNNNNVILNWETAIEINNYGFEIERKGVEENWSKIGFVEGMGNSNTPKSYKFIDNKLIGGSKFIYRLKQIDIDGKYDFSDEIEIEIIPKEFAVYQNYPNPFNPNTKIRYQLPQESKVVIKLYDMLGAEVITLLNEKKEPGIYEVDFNGQNLSSGTYIYRIVTDGFIETKKMMLLK
jgi:hypothetical protein